MDDKRPENHTPSEVELEAMLQELLKAQLALGKNITETSQFLRFVLTLANENLGVIHTQLERIRDLAGAIDEGGSDNSDCA